MANWLSNDCYENGELTVFLLEEEGTVCGIYGDDDWACRNADWNTEGSGEVTVVKRITFRRHTEEEVYRAEPDTDDEGDAAQS